MTTYDINKLFRAALSGDDDAAPREMLDSIKLEYGPLADLLPQPDPSKAERAIYIPGAHFRDLTIGNPIYGGVLKETGVWATPFPPRQVVPATSRMTWLPDPVGDVRLATAHPTTVTWLASEGTLATETQPTITATTLSPKVVSAYTEISRQLIQQSTAMDLLGSLVLKDLMWAIEKALFHGGGASGQPKGLLHTDYLAVKATGQSATASINAVLDGVDSIGANVDYGDVAILAGRTAFRKLAAGVTAPPTADQSGRILINGFLVILDAALDKDTIIGGPWGQLVGALWGGVQVIVNPYANFAAGISGVRASVAVDFAPLNSAAFSAAVAIA